MTYDNRGYVGDDYGVSGVELIGDDDYGVHGQEIVGQQWVVGADDGAPRVGTRREIRNTPDTRWRRGIAGIPPTAINPAVQATISLQPQWVFRIARLVAPSNIAQDFALLDLRVGQVSQLVTVGQIPMLVLSEVAINVFIHCDTAMVGNLISLDVVNISAVAGTFRGALLGVYTKP
jgi:hypothetical protein